MQNAKDMIKDIRAKGYITAFSLEDYFPENDHRGTEYYIEASEDGSQLLYGTICNTGLLEHGRIYYDPVLTADENIQALIEFAVENESE